jgi:N-succinyldiaminopimelate aminotransferase
MYEGKLALLRSALDSCGLKYVAPQGTYFVMTDYSDLFAGTPT